MPNYVVIARFDAETEAHFLALRKALKESGFSMPVWPPHITLATYENPALDQLQDWTARFAAAHKKQKISFQSISLLPPGGEHSDTTVLCLNPAHARSFVDFY